MKIQNVTVVTRDVGGKSTPTAMSVVPAAGALDFSVASLPRGLADLLSSFLAQEREGVHLYRVLAGRAARTDWRETYVRFGKEAGARVTLYETLVRNAGGDPMYVSPSARLACFRATKLLETGQVSGSFDLVTQQLADLEAVTVSEQRCFDNLRLLGEIAQALDPGAVRDAMQSAVTTLTADGEKHLTWARLGYHEAQLALAHGHSPLSAAT